MIDASLVPKVGTHFACVDLGGLRDLSRFTYVEDGAPFEIKGKIFLKQVLDLTSAEISFNTLPPRKSYPFYHKHQLNEEIYIFYQGQGEFQVDDCIFSVVEGSIVRVDPEGFRCLRNTSTEEDLGWIVLQARAQSYRDQHTIQDGIGLPQRVSWVGKERL
ncbi:MAG: cupin domain-containing protein [Synechococcaceae cyanobacterium SM2_3_1]|nr:cupin domain-containing protein [Synechococcaceae cyanobacterium SM2_3_1]